MYNAKLKWKFEQNTTETCQRARLTEWVIPGEKTQTSSSTADQCMEKFTTLCQKLDWPTTHSPVNQPHLWQNAPSPGVQRLPYSTSLAEKSHRWPASTMAWKKSLQLAETALWLSTHWPQQIMQPKLPSCPCLLSVRQSAKYLSTAR